ncbi:hypothetical protein DFH06DRAFT_1154162 [Mycena polygramma]|nr:hypothetical protein DFH06DRAFT_1154162 [Mycena polygramma]
MASSGPSSEGASAPDALDTPLAVLRSPRPQTEEEAPACDLLDDLLDAPLATLRPAGEQAGYLLFAAPASPALTEIADEEEVLEYIPNSAAPHPNTAANAGVAENVQHSEDDATLPPSSSTRSMVNQMIRSFETRVRTADNIAAETGSSPSAASTAPSGSAPPKKKAPPKSSRSLASLSSSEAAPSEAEPTNQNLASDVARLKSLTVEGRGAISELTRGLNLLVDLPAQMAALHRSLRALENRAQPAPPQSSASQAPPTNRTVGIRNAFAAQPSQSSRAPGPAPRSNGGGNTKRTIQRVFSPPPDSASKRPRTDEDQFYYDVYMQPVNTHFGTAIQIARYALEQVGMPIDAVASALHPYSLPKDLISLRFNDSDMALTFMDRVRANPTEDLARVKVCTPSAYAKQRDGNTGSGKQKSRDHRPCLNIITWNIHGRLAVKIEDPEIIELIVSHDIVVFLETFLRPGEEQTLQLPRGYVVVAMSRPDRPGLKSAWGGVAAVIKIGVQYKLCAELSGPDLIVLDLVDTFLVGAYLLPASSNWQDWSAVDPTIRFQEALTACSLSPDKPLLAAGDMNARIANKTPRGSTLSRVSRDGVLNTRGRWLLRLCGDLGLLILNGTVKEATTPGAFTSFQAVGSTVIDFVIVSPGILPWIQDHSIHITQMLDWSDHAHIDVGVTSLADRQYGHAPIALKPTIVARVRVASG